MAEEETSVKDAGSGQFAPQKIYIKDLSFETPHSPEIFTEIFTGEWNPAVNMNLSSEGKPIGEKLYEIVLTITVTVTMEEKTAYLVEAHQAGIFHIDGFSEEIIARMIATICPNILFPFAREHIADLVTRGGVPQLLLAPVNFDALYQQHQQQNSTPSTESETKH